MTTDLSRAIDGVLLAGVTQREWLERNEHPPLTATLAEAVAFYKGPRVALSLWVMCKAVGELWTVWGTQLGPDTTTEVNLPFEHIPQCACDPGSGVPLSSAAFRAKVAECKLRGGPCRETVAYPGGPGTPVHEGIG